MKPSEGFSAASCIEACIRGAIAADRNWSACLHEADVKALGNCIRLSADCSQLCRTVAFLISHGSPFARQLCDLCASACDACAKECESHAFKHCRECAEACRTVAEECRRYAKH
jgi:hypothetical protein